MRRLLVLGFLLLPLTASAAMLRAGESVDITSAVNDDAYVAGGNVRITREVAGDLAAGGGDVDVMAAVQDDVAIGGGNVRIGAPVGGDARIAGGTTTISANIDGDLVVFGGQVYVGTGVTIGGDVVFVGGQLTMNGTVNGDASLNGGRAVIDGRVNGNADISMDELSMNGTINGTTRMVVGKITIGEDAVFSKPVEYSTEGGETDFGDSAKAGATFHDDWQKERADDAAKPALIASLIGGFSVYWFLVSAVFIGVILLLASPLCRAAADKMLRRPWMSALIGLAYFILTPIAAVLLFITIIGIPLAAVVTALYFLSFLFVVPLAAVVCAYATQLYRHAKWSRWTIFFCALGYWLALFFIGWIPLFGWVANTAIVLMALGAKLSADAAVWSTTR